jgi:opacity protein-like surface antigen
MKKNILSIHVVGIALLAGALNASAADPGNMYLNANVGGAYLQNVDISGGAEAEFDIGMRLDAALGYHLNNMWSIEFESGWIWNSLDSIENESVPSGFDFDLYQVPLLVNAVVHFPTECAWKPYIGAGIGGVASVFSIETPSVDDSGSSFTFAYQLKAGVGYAFAENMMVDVGYKLFGTLEQEWDFGPGTIESDPLFTHSLLLSFTWLF